MYGRRLEGIDLFDFANVTITPTQKTTGAVQGWLSDHGMGWLVNTPGGGPVPGPWYKQKPVIIGGAVAASALLLFILMSAKKK